MFTRSTLRARALATLLAALAPTLTAAVPVRAAQASYTIPANPVTYHTVRVADTDVFYREAGPKDAPTILLLHGFPSSSHQFRDLIPLLADSYHVIAPDYPGFGYSAQPDRARFAYTFEHLYEIVDAFTHAVGAEKFPVYIQDYGSPIGLRFALRQPQRVTALIVQNGNAYEAGFSPIWDPIKADWAAPTPEHRRALRSLLSAQTTIFQYTEGAPAERRNPDAWYNDQQILDRPGNDEIQLDLFENYRTNVALYPAFHESFRTHRFPTLIVWGRNDPIFTVAGAEAYKTDLPRAELHYIDGGHFALETAAPEIAGYIRDFLPRALAARR